MMLITAQHGTLRNEKCCATSMGKWLTGAHPLLNHHRPLYMIERNRIAEVLSAIQQDESGSYT